jgi:hypothetical protein
MKDKRLVVGPRFIHKFLTLISLKVINGPREALNRSMTVLVQSKEYFIKQHDDSVTLVFLQNKTIPIPYKIRGTWPIEFPTIRSIQNQSTNPFTLFSIPLLGESFDTVSFLVCLKTSLFFITQAR